MNSLRLCWHKQQVTLGGAQADVLKTFNDNAVEPLKEAKSSSLRSPMVKMVAQEFNAERRDTDLTGTLASQRLTQPKRSVY